MFEKKISLNKFLIYFKVDPNTNQHGGELVAETLKVNTSLKEEFKNYNSFFLRLMELSIYLHFQVDTSLQFYVHQKTVVFALWM